MEREATLMEILSAREARAREQERLRAEFHAPVISFTMNIPGPVKDSPLIRRGFQEGMEQLTAGIRAAGLRVLRFEERRAHTGCEALYSVTGAAEAVKAVCVSIEDGSPLGRLFDMDVISSEGDQLGREESGNPPRGCMVCGAPGRDCAARRTHSVEELQAAVRKILISHFRSADRARAAALVTQALMDEVCITPKPGLVDRANNGSHRDMDIFTFHASAAALAPYWAQCVQIGQETAASAPEDTFSALRRAGQAAERTMFAATGGINTHKGAIFTLGIICGSVGRLWRPEAPCRDPEAILRTCGDMTSPALTAELAGLEEERAYTAGQRLYVSQRISGIRGEAAQGFPSVRNVALPALRAALSAGQSRNDAGCAALLRLIAQVTDTNMIARGGVEAARRAAEVCNRLLSRELPPRREEIDAVDREFIRQNLSPGGCADLLSSALFLLSWENQGQLSSERPGRGRVACFSQARSSSGRSGDSLE